MRDHLAKGVNILDHLPILKSGTTIAHNPDFSCSFNVLYTQTRPKLGFLSQWDPDRVAPASLASGLNLSF